MIFNDPVGDIFEKIILTGRYPTLFWNSEHPQGHLTVGIRYLFDDDEKI